MKESNNNTWKRIAAGALSLALVAGALPANVGGFLTGGNVLVASAETQYYTVNAPDYAPDSVGEATDTYGNKVVVSQRFVGGDPYPLYTATAAQGYKFDHWSCSNSSGNHFDDTENPLKSAFELTATAYFVKLTAPTAENFTFTAPTDLTYNGTAKSATVTKAQGVTGMGAITVKYSSDNGTNWSATAPTNAGTYKVGVTVTEGTDYAASTDVITSDGWSFTIAKADPTVSTAPTALNPSYTGEGVALVTEGSATGGTLQYKVITDNDIQTVKGIYNNMSDEWYIGAALYFSDTGSSWSSDVPQATEAGNYIVGWRIVGDDNHKDAPESIGSSYGLLSTIYAGKYTPVTIDYANTSLTLGQTLTGAVVVEDGTTNALAADETSGAYTLTGTKKYHIYTNKSIASSEAGTALDLTSKSTNKTFNGTTYSYRYEIEVPAIPAENGYLLSHTNNFVGKVSTAVGKANVMNIQEDGVTTEDVAVLNADGVIYYGDQLEKDELVTIADGYGSIVNVDEIYLENNTASGGKVTGDALVIGTTYLLTAKVSVDADGDPTNGVSGNTVYLKQQVTYAARPMNKNSYFLQTEDGLVPLEVSDSTVNVPENYWVCTLKDDSSNSYIRTEEPDEAINAIFNCTKKSTFVYNSKAQKPVIVVKNGGDNTIVLADTAVEADTTATPPVAAVAKDYNNAAAEKTDAGSYSYALTAEANGKYSDSVTVAWSIAKADVSDYITVAPKNNVDTNNTPETLEAIVYDGAVLDGTDFEVKTNEAYTQLAADSPVKALVDEFIAQLKGTPAVEADPANNIEAQPAVAAKTVVSNVSATQEQTKALLSSYKDSNGKVTTDTFSRSIVDCGLTIDPYSNNNGNITGAEYISINNTTTNQTVVNQFVVGTNGSTITYNSETHGIQIGETVLTPSEGKYFEIVRSYRSTKGANSLNITGLTITESDLTASVQTTPKNAGDYKANVTVSNSNFEDIVFNDQDVTIAKRDVTLTPDEDLSMAYRDTAMPDLTYTIEDAKADGLTGVIAADKALFQKTTGEGADAVTTNTGAIYVDKLVQAEAEANAVYFAYAAAGENNAKDYSKAVVNGVDNNAGSYTYKAFDFDNYVVVFPDDAPTFTVDPLNLKNIENLNIVLNGGDGWTQDGNSGYYSYDGTTKQVQVNRVAIPTGEMLSTEFSAGDLMFNSQTGYYSYTKDDVTVNCIAKSDSSGTPILVKNDCPVYIEIPYGAVISSVEIIGAENGTYTINGTQYTATNYSLTLPASAFTNGNTIACTSELCIDELTINYVGAEKFVLREGTDYTVGGATKRASAGTHEVQVMGRGNYTGVVTADWQIVTAEAGETALILANATKCEEGASYDYSKTYDGKAVTGTVAFTDPTSDYALDAEVEYKYYQGRYTKEQVTAADFNATAIDAPVNAFYPNGEGYLPHAGEYTVVATITCDGYADQVLVKTVNIAPIDLRVEEDAATKNITYGDALPAVTQADIDAIIGLTDTDKAYFQKLFTDGKLKFSYKQTGENTYDYNKIQIIPIISKEEDLIAFRSVVFNYNTDNFFWTNTNKAKSIKDSSIKVEFTEGDTIVLKADGTFASDNAIKVYDTAILGADGKATELTELGAENATTADYELTIESTATDGVYTLELIGKNNYRGVRKIQFKAITEAQNATTFTENAPKALNNGKTRVVCSYDVAVADGFTITEKGLLYCNNGSVTDVSALVLNSGNASIKTAKNYTYGNIVDNGQGVICVAYAKVMDADGNTEVLYSGNLGGKYSELMSTFTENAPKALNNGKNRVVVSYEASAAEGCTITESGLIYSNDGSVTDVSALVLNSGNASIKTAKNYTYGNIVDNGYGVIAVAYAKVTDSAGNESVIYSGNLGGKYTELIAAFTENAPTAMNNGKNRVVCSYSVAAAEGYTIDEKGLIYSNDGTVTDASALVLESGNASIKTAKNYTYGNIVDNGYGVIAVAYAKVTDSNGNTIVVYSGNLGGKYAVLQIS